MKTIRHVDGNLIKKLYTKFFFVNGKLCYQIVISYDNNQVLYKDYKEYKSYCFYHNLFVEAINSKNIVDVELKVIIKPPWAAFPGKKPTDDIFFEEKTKRYYCEFKKFVFNLDKEELIEYDRRFIRPPEWKFLCLDKRPLFDDI